jgi:iron complex transport system substrate-binding protein
LRGLPLVASLVLGTASACGRAASAPARLVVIDDAGDTLGLAGPARRIVSLNPSTTEILFAIGAGPAVVARSAACDYPPEVADVPSVGGGFPPNVEAVVSYHPDLIVLYQGAANETAAARFHQLGAPLLRLRTDHLSDVPRVARLLGRLTGKGAAAESVATRFESGLNRERSKRAPTASSVLILAWDQPIIALGSGSFVSELVELAGGRNVFGDITAPSAPVTLEAVAERRPDVVLTVGAASPAFAERPEWRAVAAVRRRHLVSLTESAFNRPSPRAPQAIGLLRARLALTP